MKTDEQLVTVNADAKGVGVQRLVRQLAKADRITAKWRSAHTAILQDVGYEMWQMRQDKKISLRSMARKMGISPSFLSDMEYGNRKYSIEWVKKAYSILSA